MKHLAVALLIVASVVAAFFAPVRAEDVEQDRDQLLVWLVNGDIFAARGAYTEQECFDALGRTKVHARCVDRDEVEKNERNSENIGWDAAKDRHPFST